MTSPVNDSSDSDKEELRLKQDTAARNNSDSLFGKWKSLEDKVESAAAFLRYIADRLIPHHCIVDAPTEIALRAEQVFLWIRGHLFGIPPEAQEQIIRVLTSVRPDEIVAAVNSLNEETRRRLLRARFKFNPFNAIRPRAAVDKATEGLLSEESLVSVRIALQRIAGMLEYSAKDADDRDEDEEIYFRENYDPSRIDRSRLEVLLTLLEEQVDALPDENVKKHLLSVVKELHREAKRTKPRWTRFVGKAIILLAIVADIKSVRPEVFDGVFNAVDAIVRNFVCEAQASHKTPPVSDPTAIERHWAIVPKRLEFHPRKDDASNDGD